MEDRAKEAAVGEGRAPRLTDQDHGGPAPVGSVTRLIEAVWAAVDVAATARFLREGFDLEDVDRGCELDGGQVLLGASGSDGGRIRVVPAVLLSGSSRSEPPAVWDPGPRLLGIYSRDLEATVSRLAGLGAHTRPVVGYAYGAAQMREAVARGPDGVWWTIPQVPVPPMSPQPSPALGDPGRRHSELHSAVVVADDHEAAVRFFVEGGGMEVVFDGEMAGEPFERLVGLPPGGSLRIAFLVGPDRAPARIEVMSFPTLPGVPARRRSPEPLGIQRLVLGASDVAATRTSLVAAGGTLDATDPEVVVGPAGVRIVLVEDRRPNAPLSTVSKLR